MGNEYDEVHLYNVEEKYAFANVVNVLLQDEANCDDLLPINPADESLFNAFQNGVLLCKLI